jgi:hypothetical protein
VKAYLFGVIAFLLGACTEPGCTLVAVPGVVVEIRDGADGAPLAATARGLVQDGSYTDSLELFGAAESGEAISRAAAIERPGVYAVVVEHDGYEQWRREGVRVRGGDCHVRTEHLRADLQRESTGP